GGPFSTARAVAGTLGSSREVARITNRAGPEGVCGERGGKKRRVLTPGSLPGYRLRAGGSTTAQTAASPSTCSVNWSTTVPVFRTRTSQDALSPGATLHSVGEIETVTPADGSSSITRVCCGAERDSPGRAARKRARAMRLCAVASPPSPLASVGEGTGGRGAPGRAGRGPVSTLGGGSESGASKAGGSKAGGSKAGGSTSGGSGELGVSAANGEGDSAAEAAGASWPVRSIVLSGPAGGTASGGPASAVSGLRGRSSGADSVSRLEASTASGGCEGSA